MTFSIDELKQLHSAVSDAYVAHGSGAAHNAAVAKFANYCDRFMPAILACFKERDELRTCLDSQTFVLNPGDPVQLPTFGQQAPGEFQAELDALERENVDPHTQGTTVEPNSRSNQRRIAIQRGEEMPTFASLRANEYSDPTTGEPLYCEHNEVHQAVDDNLQPTGPAECAKCHAELRDGQWVAQMDKRYTVALFAETMRRRGFVIDEASEAQFAVEIDAIAKERGE